MHVEKALEKVNYAGLFPWVTKEMEIYPDEAVLVYTSPNGIVYNVNLVPKDKAPKNYLDLVDPALEPGLGGKISDTAIRRLAGGVCISTGATTKSEDFARKLVGDEREAGCATAKRNALSAANFRSWRTSATR